MPCVQPGAVLPPWYRRVVGRSAGPLTGGPLLLWQAAFFLGPLLLMGAMTLWSVKNYRLQADVSLASWRDVLTSAVFYGIYLRTVGLALAASAIATALALPLAYAVAFQMRAAGRRLLLAALIMPYFTSYLVRSYTWRFMLEDRGVINSLLADIGLGPIRFQGSLSSLILGYVVYVFPLVAFVVSLSMIAIGTVFVEASTNLGASPVVTARTVVLPLSKPGIVMAFSFAFTLVLGDYVVPSYIGGGALPTLSILIVNAIQGQSDFPRAAVIATIMVATLAAFLIGAQAIAFPGPRRER